MRNLIVSAAVILAMLFIPLPVLFIEISYGALFICTFVAYIIVQTKKDFPSFPKVSLILTLLDLAIAISCTRIILISKTIHVLQVEVSLLYIVYIVIAFVILVFSLIFINRKTVRASAVSACFILDSMNQRLFNIDFKQTSGQLSPEEADEQEDKIKSEVDFFSKLDGCSKFLYGNAKAIIVIYFISLIGGIFIGVYQNGLTFQDAINTISLAALVNLFLSIIPLIVLSLCIIGIIQKQAAV